MISPTTPTAATAAVQALHGMPARLRQERETAERDPVSGPVEEASAGEGRVGGVGTQEKLSPAEEEQLRKLKKRDAEVRAHEQAHLMAAGPYAQGPPKYEYQTGPDGKRYAIGGSVKIDTRPVPGDPQATIQKAQVIQRAALAPKDPSPADRRIAREARRMEMKARQELELQRQEANRNPEKASDRPASGPAARRRPILFMPTTGTPYELASQDTPPPAGSPPQRPDGYNPSREAVYRPPAPVQIDRYV
ncbi:MAG: hypothetical protein D6746_03000 [Bacteroidetes bacterium]|nr:MAG: hypothetical protein D6746_03000 [Bacteroidota bacterium]